MIGANMMPIPQMAIAIPRCFAGHVSIIVACERGTRGPPARPWGHRMSTMATRLGAAPVAPEVIVNAAVATMKSRLRPSRSVSHPETGRLMALATRNDVSTQVISSTPAESVPRMWSSATLAMVMSSMTRNVVIIVVTATMARCRPGLVLGRGSAQLDDRNDRHAGHEQRVAVLTRLEHELHRDTLDDLHEVPGGVLGRQKREA